MLRLRLMTLLAAGCLATYFYLLPEPLLLVVRWNLVFVSMHVFQLVHSFVKHNRHGAASEATRSADANLRCN